MSESATATAFTVQTLAIIAAPGLLYGITLTPAAAASSVIVYDNATTNSGSIIAQLAATANGATTELLFNTPVFTTKGITVACTGTGATGVAYTTIC